MLILSLITLAIASISAFVSLNAKEEVFKVAMAFLAIVSIVLTLILAPWELQLILAAITFAIARFNRCSIEKSTN